MLHGFTAIFTYHYQSVKEVVALEFRSNHANLTETMFGALNHAIIGTYLASFEFELVGVNRTGSEIDDMYRGHVDVLLQNLTYVHRTAPLYNTIEHEGGNVYRFIMSDKTRNNLASVMENQMLNSPKVHGVKCLYHTSKRRGNTTVKLSIKACKYIVESFMLEPDAYEYRFEDEGLL